MKNIEIQGMHCGACQKLIQMELDEVGLNEIVESYSEPVDNRGKLYLKDSVTPEELELMKKTINAMDNYQVIEPV